MNTLSTDKPVRTRFAPSPTGPLHIGGVRSALFGWLLARRHNGQFVLRIEDTDQKRFVEGSVEMVMEALSWLGMNWDEGPDIGGEYGPYYQSQRLELYQKWAQWLIDNDKAYRAYDTSEELKAINDDLKARKLPPGYDGRHRNLTADQEQAFIDEGRKPVVRFKAPSEGKTVVHDLVRGEIEFDNKTVQDAVLLKSDGFPTYHLAHIIDDHFMEISHVTRANEWLPSLPLHVLLWQAFDWEMPLYAHLPVLLNPNGKGKMSKRQESFADGKRKVYVLSKEYQDAGYLPEAMVNFLTNIGWNFGDDREVFDVAEAIERFDITEVNPANSAFPIEKLDWLNGIYIREKLSLDELAARLRIPLEAAGLTVDDDTLAKITPLVQTRITTLNDVVDLAGFFFQEEFRPPETDVLIQRKMDADGTKAVLQRSIERLADVTEWSTDNLHNDGLAQVEEMGLKNGQVFGTLRVAVTGQKVSTPTFETMEVIGKNETLRRLEIALEQLA